LRANRKQRTYARVSQPTNDEIGSRQALERAALATTAVGRLFAVDPGLVAATMADSARRVAASGGIALAPSAVLAALLARLQKHFLLENGVSGSLRRRFRLLLGPGSGLATTQALRADMRAAEAGPRNAATTHGSGAFLVSARVALQGRIDDLCDYKQFIERFVRGSDCAEIASTSPFLGQASPTKMYEADARTVQVCFGPEKGGVLSSTKAVFSCANQHHPCSRGNTLPFCVFPAAKDDHAALSAMADVYVPDLDALRMGGLEVAGERRAVLLIVTGDYQYMTAWCGHVGASRNMPGQRCTAMRRVTKTNREQVAIYGEMQAGSRAGGKPSTIEHFKKMAAAYTGGGNDTLSTPLKLEEHLSIEIRPLIIIEPQHIAPMPLHLTLGITVCLLRLGIEAIKFWHGKASAAKYAHNLASTLRQSVGVSPTPYFSGAFEGRQCQRVGERLSLICVLLSAYVSDKVRGDYSEACATWRRILPILTRVNDVSSAEMAAFRRDAASLVDNLKAAFEWNSVTPKLHTLCRHAADILEAFGCLGRYSEQRLEAWHRRIMKNSHQGRVCDGSETPTDYATKGGCSMDILGLCDGQSLMGLCPSADEHRFQIRVRLPTKSGAHTHGHVPVSVNKTCPSEVLDVLFCGACWCGSAGVLGVLVRRSYGYSGGGTAALWLLGGGRCQGRRVTVAGPWGWYSCGYRGGGLETHVEETTRQEQLSPQGTRARQSPPGIQRVAANSKAECQEQ